MGRSAGACPPSSPNNGKGKTGKQPDGQAESLTQRLGRNLGLATAAIAAVDAYNRPAPRFRSTQYLVIITIAWTALFHATFYKRGRRPRYRRKTSRSGRAIRYVKIEGEPKHWDLAECLKQYYSDQHPPARTNLDFLIGLRNKIEHRHLPELDASLYRECQAALLNLEELLTVELGAKYALQEQPAVSLQFTQLVPVEKRRAAKVLARGAAKSVTDYVEKFRGHLPSTVLNSMKNSFYVFLVPRVAGCGSRGSAVREGRRGQFGGARASVAIERADSREARAKREC